MADIIKINDLNAPVLNVYTKFTDAQLVHCNEPKSGFFITESPKVIERAMNAGYEPVSILTEIRHIDGELSEIIKRCGNIPIYTAESDILTKLTGFRLTRGALCAMKRKNTADITDICKNAERIAVLENVVNPTNIGAVFRSAAALNIDAVLLTPSCSDPLYRRASRVSMGTVFQIPWTYICSNQYEWEQNGIDILKNMGFQTAAMALSDNSINIDDIKLSKAKKLAIILGTEGEGLLKSTIEKCDYTVKIPMSNGVDSLNVAAASAVAFWQLGRK